MKYHDLRDFLTRLEQRGELKRISQSIDPELEMTEIADRMLRAGGPALLFENPKGYDVPVLCNLFGTPKRVMFGVWLFLRQFMYTKFLLCDDDVNARDWNDVIRAITTRMDPARDTGTGGEHAY